MPKDPKDINYCSFCGKSEEDVRKLIVGPQIFICDECVAVCNEMLREAGIDPIAPLPPGRSFEDPA